MIAFLVVVFFLLLGSDGYDVDGIGVVRNVQGNTADYYIFIGHNLSLWCNLSITDVDANSRLMYFTKGNYELIPMDYITIVNTKTIQLNYPIISINDEGNYVCNLNGTTHRTVGNQFVTVEYETKPAKNINCLVYNWENMTCTWELGVLYNHMEDMEVHLIWTIMEGWFYCPHMSPGKRSCTWKKRDGDDSFRSQHTYQMQVLVKNKKDPDETEKRTETAIYTYRIVKPAPVVNLHAGYENTTCTRISWHHSSFYDKYYEIAYTSQWDSKTKSRTTEDTDILICNLTPYTMYTFRVRCRPDIEGYWSNAAEFLNRTPEDVPAGAPLMKPGSYAEYPCSTVGCREILIYWKPISLQARNGEITEYIMNVTGINLDGAVGTQFLRHILGDRNYLKISLESSINYQIRLSAATGAGIATNFSSLFISSHYYDLPSPVQFVVEADENQVTSMHFTWREPVMTDGRTSVISYTLYWCEGSVVRAECDGDLNWISLPAHQTSYKMYAFPSDFDAYIFGISVDVVTLNEQTVSRGLQWSDCTYKADGVPRLPPKNVLVNLFGQDIRIDWDPYDCFESRGHVISYRISYCVRREDNICSGERRVNTGGDAVDHLLRGLDVDETYYITVSPITRVGEGPRSLPVSITIPFSGMRKETVAGVVVAVLVVLILAAVGLRYVFKKFFKLKKRCDVPQLESDFSCLPDSPLKESFGQNPKKSPYKGDKPREYTSSTRSLLQVSDDNSEMSEQNKGQCDNSQGKRSSAGNSFSEMDPDCDTVEIVSESKELENNIKNNKKRMPASTVLGNGDDIRLNPLLRHDDYILSNIPSVANTAKLNTNRNWTIGPYTKFGSDGCIPDPQKYHDCSSLSDIPTYSRFGSCGELIGICGGNSHHMQQSDTFVTAEHHIIHNAEKSSDLVHAHCDELTSQRRERHIPNLKLTLPGEYYTLNQVNEQNSSPLSSPLS